VLKLFLERRNSSPTPSLSKRRGLIQTDFKVPLFLREGFRVSFLLTIEFSHKRLQREGAKDNLISKEAV
jgi:hypothetical protein